MPIYEYQCKNCKTIYEKLVISPDEEPTKCGDWHCNGKLEKIMSKGSFQLKGTGWSSTNYSNTSKEK